MFKIKLYWSASNDGTFEVRAETVPATESYTVIWPTRLARTSWHSKNLYLRNALWKAQIMAFQEQRKKLGWRPV